MGLLWSRTEAVVTQHSECATCHGTAHFKGVILVLHELHLNLKKRVKSLLRLAATPHFSRNLCAEGKGGQTLAPGLLCSMMGASLGQQPLSKGPKQPAASQPSEGCAGPALSPGLATTGCRVDKRCAHPRELVSAPPHPPCSPVAWVPPWGPQLCCEAPLGTGFGEASRAESGQQLWASEPQ